MLECVQEKYEDWRDKEWANVKPHAPELDHARHRVRKWRNTLGQIIIRPPPISSNTLFSTFFGFLWLSLPFFIDVFCQHQHNRSGYRKRKLYECTAYNMDFCNEEIESSIMKKLLLKKKMNELSIVESEYENVIKLE